MSATLEYLTREILDLAGDCAKQQNRNRIDPRDLQIAVRNDDELHKLVCQIIVTKNPSIENDTAQDWINHFMVQEQEPSGDDVYDDEGAKDD